MFERPRSGERALLVRIGLGAPPGEEELSEFEALARSAGAEVVGVVTGTRRAPDPRLYVGSGKAQEIRTRIEAEGADLAVFDHALSPSQERNLEALLRCRVLDRTGLILDIFAQRARSFEGQLQVELAQLKHLSTRLVRGWSHLERQKGGIGLRGPGETQLETDRRLLGKRIKTLNARLDKVITQRETTRRERRRAEIPTVALVGYTNAGKTTLFNRLTGAQAYAADQLFATLDPAVRRIELADARQALLADTVGFVRELPHELVAAFRSTLQEARQAALLLHVIDAADPNRGERIAQVNQVLADVGAAGLAQIEVYNKADLIGETPRVERDESGDVRRVWLSAQTGAGMPLLVAAIGDFLGPRIVRRRIVLSAGEGRARARFFEAGAVLSESIRADGGSELEVSMPARAFQLLCRTEGLESGLDAADRDIDRDIELDGAVRAAGLDTVVPGSGLDMKGPEPASLERPDAGHAVVHP
ncbi:GTPase HflX [Steroidobacter denitrificans]|uniref:GTPase HflX n=1 Tax=Steroidobacter denitrificans TaxID=465721 RepID=A0A127F7D7_STEDE|nr:ribosome rescue GTPase HflX [Steroidobacter denitrificans]AMN46353.1 GTPase HflX [Steroidobacter denitrificans]